LPFFDFSTEVLTQVVKELDAAEKFIKIAMFQIHNDDLFKLLSKKACDQVNIEIITLPYESIKPKLREKVKNNFIALQKQGVIIHFCKWNIGDPGRTTTAVEGWYSFHGKFIVTEKSAIILSANFVENAALDAMLIFDAHEKIDEFVSKFNHLKELFITEYEGRNGTIYDKIRRITTEEKIFELPKDIDGKHSKHWITDYPITLFSKECIMQERLYLVPFDCKGREMYERIINDANEFICISAETFTDQDFSNFLLKKMMSKKIVIRIICGAKSQDFKDRLNNMFKDLLANSIQIKSSEKDIHAKMIITENAVLISSINLNKMSLGYSKRRDLWRENTETIYLCMDSRIINIAKEKFMAKFDEYFNVEEELAKNVEKTINMIFNDAFELKFESRALSIDFAKYIVKKELELKKVTTGVGKIAKKIIERKTKIKIGKDELLSAFILYTLSEVGKIDYSQLQSKTEEFDGTANLKAILSNLEFDNLIIKEAEKYKINPEKLL